MHHCIFRLNLTGIASILITCSVSMPAAAAISNGPNYTNAVDAEMQRILQFNEAEQSYQEKLKVGRERYAQKQRNRARIIEAMSSELQARQQTVVIQPVAAPDKHIEDQAGWSRPLLVVSALIFSFIGFDRYRY